MGKTKLDWQSEYESATGQPANEDWTIPELKDLLGVGKPQAKLYWKNPTYFHKFGTVEGEVTKDQIEEWNRVVPEGVKIDRFVEEFDPVAKRREDGKLRRKKALGLKEDD